MAVARPLSSSIVELAIHEMCTKHFGGSASIGAASLVVSDVRNALNKFVLNTSLFKVCADYVVTLSTNGKIIAVDRFCKFSCNPFSPVDTPEPFDTTVKVQGMHMSELFPSAIADCINLVLVASHAVGTVTDFSLVLSRLSKNSTKHNRLLKIRIVRINLDVYCVLIRELPFSSKIQAPVSAIATSQDEHSSTEDLRIMTNKLTPVTSVERESFLISVSSVLDKGRWGFAYVWQYDAASNSTHFMFPLISKTRPPPDISAVRFLTSVNTLPPIGVTQSGSLGRCCQLKSSQYLDPSLINESNLPNRSGPIVNAGIKSVTISPFVHNDQVLAVVELFYFESERNNEHYKIIESMSRNFLDVLRDVQIRHSHDSSLRLFEGCAAMARDLMVCVNKADLSIVVKSKAFDTALGCAKSNVSIASFMEDASVISNIVNGIAKSSNKQWKGEITMERRNDGQTEEIIFETIAFPVDFTSGSLQCIGFLFRDTASGALEKRDRSHIQAMKQRLDFLINGSNDLLGLLNLKDGRFHYLNKTGMQLLGIKDGIKEVPRFLDDIIVNMMEYNEKIQPLLLNSQSFIGELQMHNLASGERIPTEVNLFNVKGNSAIDAYVIGMAARDLRDEKRLERKRALADYDMSKIEAMVNSCNDFISIVDVQTKKIVFLNRTGMMMIGAKLGTAKELTPSDVHPAKSLELLFGDCVAQCKRVGKWTGELEFKHLVTHEIILTEAVAVTVPSSEDKMLVGKICRDIRERRKEQEALALREMAISSTNDAICICDFSKTDYPIVYCNAAYFRLTGYSGIEIMGRNPRILQGENTSKESIDKIRAAVHAHQSISIDILNYRKNGDCFWNQLSLTPVISKGGELTHMISVSRDVTTVKVSEIKKLELRQKAIGSSKEGIIITDLNINHRILYGNASFARISGYNMEEITKLSLFDIFDKSDGKASNRIKHIEQVTQRGESISVEVPIILKDHQEAWVRLAMGPISGSDANHVRFTCVVSDITEQKQVLIQLRKAKQDEENKRKEREEAEARKAQEAEEAKKLAEKKKEIRRKKALEGMEGKTSATFRVLVAEAPGHTDELKNVLWNMGIGEYPRCQNGVEVLDLLEEEEFDIVFMDMKMPRLDGLDCSKQIRSRFSAVDRPQVIGLTSNVMNEDKCMSAGMFEVMVKPYDMKTVERILKRCQLRGSRHSMRVKHEDKRVGKMQAKTDDIVKASTAPKYDESSPRSRTPEVSSTSGGSNNNTPRKSPAIPVATTAITAAASSARGGAMAVFNRYKSVIPIILLILFILVKKFSSKN